MLVDDDVTFLKTVEKLLQKEDYECSAYLSAKEAVEKVKGEEFDLIISDIRMPGKNGVEAMKEIREFYRSNSKRKDVPVIFITGYAKESLLLHADNLGEVIIKPFDKDRFLMTIREYL